MSREASSIDETHGLQTETRIFSIEWCPSVAGREQKHNLYPDESRKTRGKNLTVLEHTTRQIHASHHMHQQVCDRGRVQKSIESHGLNQSTEEK